MQLALDGAKTMSPLLAGAAPANLKSLLMVDEISTHANVLLVVSNTPTQSAQFGAKTTRPSLVVSMALNL
eukprot:7186477-Prymnesium_polylepis.2